MDYPKQVMKMKEMLEMGFPEEFLLRAYRSEKQTFAWKMDMTKKNSTILFDTAQFEKYRLGLISIEQKANKLTRVV